MNRIKYFGLLLLTTGQTLKAPFKFSGNKSLIGLDKTNSTLTLNTSISNYSGTLKLRSTTGTTDGNVKSATGAETISFSGGSLCQGTNTVDLTGGSYDPKTGSTRDALTLSGGQIMSVSAGTTLFNDVSVAYGQSATIVGMPTFVSAVSLGNSGSTLYLGLQHKLNQDIVLNGGKIVLLDDLMLADGVRIWGPGTVDVNNQTLAFGAQVNSSVFSKYLTFWRAKDIMLNGPATLTGNWSFLTNSTDNESIINGNGNVLTLTNGQITVGNSAAGHTLYISDLHIKGLADPTSPYTATGISKSTYAGISGLQAATVTAGNASYDAGFKALGTSSAALINSQAICVYDDPSFTNPIFYVPIRSGLLHKVYKNSTYTLITGVYVKSVDVATDGPYVFSDITSGNIKLDNNSVVTNIRTGESPSAELVTIGSIANNNIFVARGSANFTTVSKYLGTPGAYNNSSSWNNSWATGYNNIFSIQASTDGYVWILDDNGGGSYGLYRTNGGPKSNAMVITLPEAPSVYLITPSGGVNIHNSPLSIKGSLSNLFGGYCGASGTIYTTRDGTTFTAIGNYGATSIGVGALGTIVFSGPNDPAIPYYVNGFSTFVQPPIFSNTFNLYDGAANNANRGKVVLSNVTLELAGNYTHNAGRITFKGDNCKIITGGNKTFNISGSNAPVEVDSTALIYDTLGGSNVSPFTGTAVTLTNGGVVRSAISSVTPVDYVINANTYNGSTAPTLTQNFTLFASSRINVTNASNTAGQTVTIDGRNYFWQFPGGTVGSLVIGAKTTVTLTNVILKDFSLANVVFGDASSGLVFGDGCVVELGADQSLTTGQGAWLFSGNAVVRGMGQTITLNGSDSIRQDGATKTLWLENCILKSLNTTSIGCDSSSTVAFTNSTLRINQNGFAWPFGNLEINGYTTFRNANSSATGALSNFNLTTFGLMTINTGATLELSRGVNFVYNPDTSFDGGANTALTKRHFQIGLSGDASATLYTSNASITTSTIGLALDRGNFIVDNKVNFTAPTASAAACEFGSALKVEILAGSVLNLDGEIKYTSTTV